MWQVGPACYSTKTAALQATASAQTGAVVQQSGGAYVVTVTSVAENGIEYTLTPLAGGTSSTVQVIQEPMPCNLLTGDDVAPIAWAIFGGWMVIYTICRIWKQGVINDT
ncbi:MAG: hypothetical protein QM569_15290 [Acidovorax sp.]|uniref:hypothetical protein n=1 Tax=Acidovorax sp. TaxID=1872122 RepID=UPI0039E4335A